MKPYRLKHIPTGLYLDVRARQPKLTEYGKIYNSGINTLNWEKDYDYIIVETSTLPIRRMRCNKSDFIKVGVKIEDVPYEN